ncbi:UDP-N-acetylglucosamine-N-acetylmuramylpentapeptide N-acetylglucosamine transferase [Rhizobiales bacterium GAS191]|nr:UDP-N-acetylglucosamine-N-acetylmuramylpentapeptide N-acetylglucosamine transferase [Rhizobiales bacterium GAS188]SEE94194.1 UDP-N-acetylglucosamine-N-acetylmuramylpentapeptide N-acetylglucosamine transferase [Rhizobiales bacterium GAS191]
MVGSALAEPRLILLAAGGTGGHLFPAEALSHALQRRGCVVELVTDTRVDSLTKAFPARKVHALPAATPSGKGGLGKGLALATLGLGTVKALALLRRASPAAVVGFGGYPTVPPLVAATMRRVPSLLHEQNAVLGRANRFLAGRVDVIATGFATVGGVGAALQAKTRHVGNPVRPSVIEAAKTAYDPPRDGGVLRLLVFGGSQGARIMSDIVPDAIARLSLPERARLQVVQQARQEDFARVRAAYAEAGVAADIAPFFRDLPFHMAQSQLVIGRAGASTVAEISVIGRPSILVPLPGSLDQDQAANAASLATIGAAIALKQPEFSPDRLAETLSQMLSAPARLADMAAKAREAGIPDAAERLADLVCETARLPALPER